MNKRKILYRLRSEEGQIWSWLLSIFLVLFVLGVLITQCGPIISNHIGIGGLADEAADRAAAAYRDHQGNMQEVTKAVDSYLRDNGARLAGDISTDKAMPGKSQNIYVPVRKIVNTYFFKNVSYLAPYTEAFAEGNSVIL
jgi:hypothetical protein